MHILLIEAFYGGSHSQLIDVLESGVKGCIKYTLPAKKWHWRARTSALQFAQVIAPSDEYRILFASSVLNLAELVALRPDLSKLKKCVYFHENQLVYPVRKQQDRDFQYGYNQILTSLVADVVIFNSKFNMESYLTSIESFLKLMPDFRPKGLVEKIRPKCQVLYFPIVFPIVKNLKHCEDITSESQEVNSENTHRNKDHSPQPHSNKNADNLEAPLHIIWPHRWEHDKNPELFFNTLYKLHASGDKFNVSVLGETFSEIPDIFTEALEKLKDHIVHWGYQESKEDYYRVLVEGDIVVSTAKHEFYGVAMLEAVHCGCYPLCPNKLVYPELFPKECLFNTDQQLFNRLGRFCKNPLLVRDYSRDSLNDVTSRCSWTVLKDHYQRLMSLN